ncbi:MAG: hypothetical protein LBU70_09885 [Chitinispirillales bacterium]|jgi:hypothetical protein|nr:hypothetical protein [Chitinispirillales bacterium]
MDLLKEFFAPISIPVLALIIAVFVLVWVLAKCFRLPPGFAVKEDFRDEVRFRLFNERLMESATGEAKKAAETETPPADAAAESGAATTAESAST